MINSEVDAQIYLILPSKIYKQPLKQIHTFLSPREHTTTETFTKFVIQSILSIDIFLRCACKNSKQQERPFCIAAQAWCGVSRSSGKRARRSISSIVTIASVLPDRDGDVSVGQPLVVGHPL